MVPRAGRLEHAEDPWQPYRLCDPAGGVVAPVAAYLRELQARGCPETTLRAYATALLRWFRFLWAVEIPWDPASRAEAGTFAAGSSGPSSLAAGRTKRQAVRAGRPALQVARRAGHGVAVLLKVYANCIDGQDGPANHRIDDALGGEDDSEHER